MNGKINACCEYVTTLSNAIEKKVPAQLPKAMAPDNRIKSSLIKNV